MLPLELIKAIVERPAVTVVPPPSDFQIVGVRGMTNDFIPHSFLIDEFTPTAVWTTSVGATDSPFRLSRRALLLVLLFH